MKKLITILLIFSLSAPVFAEAVKPSTNPQYKPLLKQRSQKNNLQLDFQNYENMCKYYLETNDDNQFLECTEKFYSQYPKSSFSFGLRAIAYQRINNCEVAVPQLTAVLAKKSAFGIFAPYLRIARAKCYYDNYDTEMSLSDYNQISQWELSKITSGVKEDFFLKRGSLFQLLELYKEAIISYTNALRYSKRKDIFYMIGHTFSQLSNTSKASDYFNEYIKKCSNDDSEECSLYYTDASNYLQNKNYYSENNYKKNIMEEMHSGNYTRAFISLDEFINSYPDNKVAIDMQDLLYQNCKNALPNLEKGVNGEIITFSNKEYIAVLNAKATCSALLGVDSMWDDKNVLLYNTYKNKCKKEFAFGHFDDALFYCNKALSYNEDIEMYYLRGQIYYQMFKFEYAYSDFTQINNFCSKPLEDYFSNERCQYYNQKADKFKKYIKKVNTYVL